jgi:hypothetical protein
MFKNDDEAMEHNLYHEWGSAIEGCEFCAIERQIEEDMRKENEHWQEEIWGGDEL